MANKSEYYLPHKNWEHLCSFLGLQFSWIAVVLDCNFQYMEYMEGTVCAGWRI